MIIEFEMNEIMPACVMEKLHAEVKIEKEREAELARKAEEERKANITKNIIKNNKIIWQINKALEEHGHLNIQTGRFRKNIWGYGYQEWELNDEHYVNHQYSLIKDIWNDELILTIYKLYKEAGYRVHIYEYSYGYYKNWNIDIYAEANCETCEV